MSDIVRVLRVIEYIGPREAIERQIERSLHGTKRFGQVGQEIQIRVATIGEYPEILRVEVGMDMGKGDYDGNQPHGKEEGEK